MALSFSPAARHQLKNLLVCLSLGNLCFLRRWYDLENLKERAMDYYRAAPADPALLIATLAGSLLLSAFFFAAWLWVQRDPTPAKRNLAYCGFLLTLIYPLESVREYWNTEAQSYDLGTNIAILAIEAILAAGIVLVLFGNLRVVRAARQMALLLTLLIPSLLIDFTWSGLGAEPASAYQPRPPAPMLSPHGSGRRVVWVLFDEFDQRLAFDLRQPKVDLPELDRLRAESFVANRVEQAAGWTTLALPSLLSGRAYGRADLIDATTLRVYPEGSAAGVSWAGEPNIFKQARAAGFNSALVGWHHPYCRVLGEDLTRCVDVASGETTPALLRETSAAEMGALRSVPFLFELQLTNLADMFRGGPSRSASERDSYVQKRQQQQFFQIRDVAFRSAADPRIDLVFAHFPLPHPFGIYNARRRDFSLNNSLNYADNLALVDRTVGELRRAIEAAGLWDSTTLVITSDHGLRPDLWRAHMGWTAELERLTGGKQTPLVPCIVKPAGEHSEVVYDRPFSAVLESDLILAMLKKEVATAAEVASWIDRHGAIRENSFQENSVR